MTVIHDNATKCYIRLYSLIEIVISVKKQQIQQQQQQQQNNKEKNLTNKDF